MRREQKKRREEFQILLSGCAGFHLVPAQSGPCYSLYIIETTLLLCGDKFTICIRREISWWFQFEKGKDRQIPTCFTVKMILREWVLVITNFKWKIFVRWPCNEPAEAGVGFTDGPAACGPWLFWRHKPTDKIQCIIVVWSHGCLFCFKQTLVCLHG